MKYADALSLQHLFLNSQSLLVYDLIDRNYVRRQRGLAVTPCLKHEYCLLKDRWTLLGLSESRLESKRIYFVKMAEIITSSIIDFTPM